MVMASGMEFTFLHFFLHFREQPFRSILLLPRFLQGYFRHYQLLPAVPCGHTHRHLVQHQVEVALLRVVAVRALPTAELVGVVHRARHDEALEPHPADVADGASEKDARLLLHSEFLVELWHPQQLPPGFLRLLTKRGYLDALLGLGFLLDIFFLRAGKVKHHSCRSHYLRLRVREI